MTTVTALTKSKGMKFDVGKPDIFHQFVSYFPRAINSVTRISEYGSRKYEEGNFIRVDNGYRRYLNAGMRHLMLSAVERYDKESGMPHLAHAAWCLLAALEFAHKDGVVDMRVGNQFDADGKVLENTFKKVEE